jgi:deoxycytidine triphosphate deaminase
MEITNFSRTIIPLVVGMRVAQIIFHEVSSIDEKDLYAEKDKYQSDFDLKKIKKNWEPKMMLPQL